MSGTARSSTMANVTDFRRSPIWSSKSMRPVICTGVSLLLCSASGVAGARECATPDERYYGGLDRGRTCVQHGCLTVHLGNANGRMDLVTFGVDHVDRFAVLRFLLPRQVWGSQRAIYVMIFAGLRVYLGTDFVCALCTWVRNGADGCLKRQFRLCCTCSL